MRQRMGAPGARPLAVFLRFAPWMGFGNSHPHDLMWPVSMLYAEGLARRRGWRTRIIDLHVEPGRRRDIVRRVVAARPDVLLVDTMTPTMAFARWVVRDIRERLPDTRVWGIGQHATEQSQDLLYPGSPYDGVLLGEYEASITDLLDAGGHAGPDGSAAFDPDAGEVVHRGARRQVVDCDALPPIDPSGLRASRYGMRSVHVPSFGRDRWGFLLTSRGCPYLCTFCSPTLRQSYGRRFRAHSARRVVDDMARLHRDHGVTAFYTIDDVFSMDRERVVEICEEILRRRLKVRWTIQTRADMVDHDLMRLMRRAGCSAVKMGVESGVDRVLKRIKKGSKRDRIQAAADDIRRAGLGLTAYYMVGHPDETLEEMHETFRFAKRIGSDMIQVAYHTPYPGSAVYEEYRDRVKDSSELAHYETHHVNLSAVDDATLERIQREFYIRYYFSPPILLRYLRRRAVYQLFDPEEWRLVARSLRYLLLPRGRGRADGQDFRVPTEPPVLDRRNGDDAVVPMPRPEQRDEAAVHPDALAREGG